MENWRLKNIKCDLDSISKDLGISKITAQVMANRGIVDIDDAKLFIDSDLSKLINPRIMKDIEKGVSILKDGILNKKSILIVGDYDVDGVISTYVLFTALKRCGAIVNYHIPDRITEGYGINESIIKNAKENNVDIIITCDNGISAIDQIQLAKELGMQVIVTDHHDIPYKQSDDGYKTFVIPPADAVINPKQEDCNYPFDKICGACVCYKLVQVLYEEFNIDKSEVESLLQFVAIATVCDVVDLVNENRIIVKAGLNQINKTDNLGLKTLLIETGLVDKSVNVYSLGFVIGPCINASGRLDFAGVALELLLTKDQDEATTLAKKLNELNSERQKLTQLGVEKAIDQIIKDDMLNDKVLVIYIPDVHESIAGIIAGRVKEKFNLPSIVLTNAHDGAKGSARSIEEFNIFEELVKCKDLLGKFGGHPMAAGLSIPSENIDDFRTLLNKNCTLSDEDIIPKVFIDVALPLRYLSFELVEELKLLEPFGKGNSKPAFGVKNLSILEGRILGKNQNVLKLILKENNGPTNTVLESIYFGDIEKFKEDIISKYGVNQYERIMSGQSNNVKIDLVYYPEINEFRGSKKLQLNISTFRF